MLEVKDAGFFHDRTSRSQSGLICEERRSRRGQGNCAAGCFGEGRARHREKERERGIS